MNSYDRDYADYVQRNLGHMLDFAVNTCDLELAVFWDMFLVSTIDKQIEQGNPKYMVGMSGPELTKLVSAQSGVQLEQSDEMYLDKSPEYWVGWALAYYQWYSGKGFSKITKAVPIKEILAMYFTLHEADISKFISIMEERLLVYYKETNLKRRRMLVGYTQKELAIVSDVKIRQIQLFEQRQRDINKAEAMTVAKLAKALICRMEDLLE